MPQQEKLISVTGIDKETVLATAYQAFQELGWQVLFAGEDALLAQTPGKWNKNPMHVTARWDEGILAIKSETIKDEIADVLGRNKKNVEAFATAFESARTSMKPETNEQNQQLINGLRISTQEAAEQEAKEAAEIDKAMNLSGSNLYITYGIIAINVLVFILMAINGAGIIEPNAYVHVNWGSNYGVFTLSGDWWRLVTSTFIHFGIIHLVMNMYCLYTVGIYLEPMLGKWRYSIAYLCTGILASVASLWWHNNEVNSAGASGAIFGMYGLFLALLTTNLVPAKVRGSLLQNIGLFVVYNLLYGVKGGVDNAAHIGGLLSGLLVGGLFAFSIKTEQKERKLTWVLPLLVLVTVGIAWFYLDKNKASDEQRRQQKELIQGESFADSEAFNEKYNRIIELQDSALAIFKNPNITDEELKKEINEKSLPLWQQAGLIAGKMENLSVSDGMKKRLQAMQEYIGLRKEECLVINDMIDQKIPGDSPKLEEVRNKINAILERLK